MALSSGSLGVVIHLSESGSVLSHTKFWGCFAEGAHRIVSRASGRVFVVEVPAKEASATYTFLALYVVRSACFVVNNIKLALD
jgi:hypothetical protein